MEKKTWRFYFTEDDYRQMRASRMSVALLSAFAFDADKKNTDPIDKYILNNTGLKLYNDEIKDVLTMQLYIVSKLEETFDDLGNKQYTEDELKEIYKQQFDDALENVVADFYINDNATPYREIFNPILSVQMDANDESSKEIIDSIEETINKAQEDSLPKIELPDELKIQEENEDEVLNEDLIEEVDLNTEEETDSNTSEEKEDELEKDTDGEEKSEDNKEDEGPSSIKVEM
ncbi:hypothetical protein [Finegoldia magna]|uniref:Uncharacterized protein n=1 Tax=Finegoldia magna (strain ATCC 29328 / DSM 20472 / WAL 2508) TaxID=334413 RepID=B0S4G4_FINM2|nr:hypothetical protein [Finegoldia magna]UEA71163.1 hypothetical protein LK415_08605 [Finegoldia magna]BAG09155.1 hypothetical protein FMG_P0106 [Finegoldia magna ATCC 29328]